MEYIVGSAHNMPIPDKSVHAIITSIPYYKKRQYAGEQLVDWTQVSMANPFGGDTITVPPMTAELGDEPTAVAFISHILLCLREMWRVLRDDGSLVLNIGDTFTRAEYAHDSFRPKDLMLIPERVAMAAHADGWYVRNAIPWVKRSHMPEGPSDRISISHETIYLLTKSPHYYFDVVGIRQPGVDYVRPGGATPYTAESGLIQGTSSRTLHQMSNDTGRHCRTMDIFDMGIESLVQSLANDMATAVAFANGEQGAMVIGDELAGVVVNPQRYPKAHYATFPLELAKLFVTATTSTAVCAQCGRPYLPQYQREFVPQGDIKSAEAMAHGRLADDGSNNCEGQRRGTYKHTFMDHRSQCNCQVGTTKAVVLDPFAGSGTTGEACIELCRDFILNDISAEYINEHCRDRTTKTMRLI